MARDKTDDTSKAVGATATGATPEDASAARPTLRYQDIPDLPETFADSIGQWLFDGQLRIEFTVTRLDPSASGQPPSTGRLVPAARMVLTPACAMQLIRQSQQLLAAVEKAAAAVQQAAAGRASMPADG
jgi:hypothetical protein